MDISYGYFDFNEMNLIPAKCIVDSRSECDTSIELTKGDKTYRFELPVIPANMECVIDSHIASKLAKHNYMYSMHRFGDVFEFAKHMFEKGLLVSISIGVNDDSKEILRKLKAENIQVDFITIDIAHGHAIKMQRMIEFVKETHPNAYIIAGNVSTAAAVQDLESWGADMIKVGIGPGSACTTYTATGFGSRGCQAGTIKACIRGKTKETTKICADGGIREPGDIAKSLALGADMVMVGGMFCGFTDSPGKIVNHNGKDYKEFWGSASHFQSNKSSRIEGTKNLIELKPRTFLQEMQYIKECLQSAISYAGGNKLAIMRSVKWLLR